MPTPGIAANTYAQLARITDGTTSLAKTIGDGAAKEGPNFADVLKDAVAGINAAGRKADTQAHNVAVGKANVIDVVTAVAEAETAVDALVAVRDNIIQSYQEVMRMTI
jgi:flagellar hook-basal body complex protein FliE